MELVGHCVNMKVLAKRTKGYEDVATVVRFDFLCTNKELFTNILSACWTQERPEGLVRIFVSPSRVSKEGWILKEWEKLDE